MTRQADLFGEAPEAAALVCAFGEAWMGPHPLCEAELARGCAVFAAAVARDDYNPRGFTPAEWAAHQRKGTP